MMFMKVECFGGVGKVIEGEIDSEGERREGFCCYVLRESEIRSEDNWKKNGNLKYHQQLVYSNFKGIHGPRTFKSKLWRP